MRGKYMDKIKVVLVLMMALLFLPVSAQANNNPVIRLSVANYDPLPVQPGQFVDVWINVENTGANDAKNLKIEYLESPYFELVDPSNKVREISVLGTYKDFLLKYRFKVADDVIEGVNNLMFEYSMDNQPGVISTVNLKLDVKSTEVPITVSSVRHSPDPVEAGKKSVLTIAVTNPSSSSNLRDVGVTLQLVNQQGSNIVSLPFAPVDSANKKSINRIRPGQTTEFMFELVTYPDAESKIYKIPVLFSYYDDVGNRYDDTLFVSLNVNSKPDIYAIIESVNIDKSARTGDVIFDIVNQGVSDIKLLTVYLDENEDLEIISSSNAEYLGNVDSDDFKSARFKVKVSETAEEVIFPLRLTFRDALNNEFEEVIEISHKLREPEGNGNNFGVLIFVLIALGIIAIIYYRRRQKRKRLSQEKDDD